MHKRFLLLNLFIGNAFNTDFYPLPTYINYFFQQ